MSSKHIAFIFIITLYMSPTECRDSNKILLNNDEIENYQGNENIIDNETIKELHNVTLRIDVEFVAKTTRKEEKSVAKSKILFCGDYEDCETDSHIFAKCNAIHEGKEYP